MPFGTEQEAGRIPIRVIKTSEELTQAGFRGIRNVEQLGKGASSHVYPLDYNQDGVTLPAVLKLYDVHPGDEVKEVPALKAVTDLPEPAHLLATVDKNVLRYAAVIKERVEGRDMRENIAIFPVKKETEGDKGEQVQKAKWIIAYLEALGKIHKRGVLMSDFKIQDALWDRKNQQVRLIDFGNAVVKRSLLDIGAKSEMHDIEEILKIFFANTSIGGLIGMTIPYDEGVANYPQGIRSKVGQAMMAQCQRSGAVPELAVLVKRFQDAETGKVEPIIDEMKNYFHALGLQVESDSEYVMRRYGKEFTEFKQFLAADLDDPRFSLDALLGAIIFCPRGLQTADQDVVARVFQTEGREFILAHYQTYPGPGEEGEVTAINRYMLIRQRESIVSSHDQLFPEAKIGDPQKPFQSRDERMAVALGIKRTELALERLKLYKENALKRGDKGEVNDLERIRVLEEQELVKLRERPGEIKRKEYEEVKSFISLFEASIIDPKAVADLWDNQSGGVAIALGFYSYWIGKYNLIKELFESQFRNFSWKEYEQVSPGFWGRLIRQKPGIPKSEETVITGYLDRKGIKKDSPEFPKEMKRIFIARLQIYQALARLDDKVKFDKVIEDCS